MEKIILSEVPLIKGEDHVEGKSQPIEGFRPYVQIFKDSKIIFNYLTEYFFKKIFLIICFVLVISRSLIIQLIYLSISWLMLK